MIASSHLLLAVGAPATDAASGVGIPLAIAAGLVSFLSPCVLPLVPAYLSTVAGVAPADLERVGSRRLLAPSLLFIGGFSSIFILLGLVATRVGSALHQNLPALRVVGGAMIVALGVAFLLTPFVRFLSFQWHSPQLLRMAGRGSPLAAGAAFAIAWTPCTSVTLGAILTQAAISSSAAHGALLLAFYSAGLAIPFLALTLAFERVTRALTAVRGHFGLIIGAGGAVLIVLGVLILTGEFTALNAQANELLQGTGLTSV
ncbi:MAG: cytochrome c biogenesis CcdA family protein [Solirubrobacteraceae bacterium]